MAVGIDNAFANKIANGTINLESASFYLMLCTAVVPLTAGTKANVFVGLNPLAGVNGNYAHGALTKANSTPAIIDTNATWLDFNDFEWVNLWSAAPVTINYACLLVGTAASPQPTDHVCMSFSLSPAYTVPTTSENKNFTVILNAAGMFKIRPL